MREVTPRRSQCKSTLFLRAAVYTAAGVVRTRASGCLMSMGTRLGYETAVCDLISQHTAMSLNTTTAALPAAADPNKPAEKYNYSNPMRQLKALVWNSARELKKAASGDELQLK